MSPDRRVRFTHGGGSVACGRDERPDQRQRVLEVLDRVQALVVSVGERVAEELATAEQNSPPSDFSRSRTPPSPPSPLPSPTRKAPPPSLLPFAPPTKGHKSILFTLCGTTCGATSVELLVEL